MDARHTNTSYLLSWRVSPTRARKRAGTTIQLQLQHIKQRQTAHSHKPHAKRHTAHQITANGKQHTAHSTQHTATRHTPHRKQRTYCATSSGRRVMSSGSRCSPALYLQQSNDMVLKPLNLDSRRVLHPGSEGAGVQTTSQNFLAPV